MCSMSCKVGMPGMVTLEVRKGYLELVEMAFKLSSSIFADVLCMVSL